MNTTSLVKQVNSLVSERKRQMDIEKKQVQLLKGTITPTTYASRLAKELASSMDRVIYLQGENAKSVADFSELTRLYKDAKGFTQAQVVKAFEVKAAEYIANGNYTNADQVKVAKAWHLAKAKVEWMQIAQTGKFLAQRGVIKVSKATEYLPADKETSMATTA